METENDIVLRTDEEALAYVKRAQNAYVANLHQVVSRAQEKEAEAILRRHGTLCYRKELWPTFNGYVNLKRLSYDAFWGREKWVGSSADRYVGAQLHARMSQDDDLCPLRVYVYASPSIQEVVAAKAEIRALIGVGNHCVHINDTHEEAIWLAETYFNGNSWAVNDCRPFDRDDDRFDGLLRGLKERIEACHGAVDDVCVTDDAVLNVLRLGACDSLKFFCREGLAQTIRDGRTLVPVDDGEMRLYPHSANEILENPDLHFYYRGMKFASPAVVLAMMRRRSAPDDDRRIRLLGQALRPQGAFARKLLRKILPRMRRLGTFLIRKERQPSGLRTVTVLKVFRFSYTSVRKRRAASDR